MPLSFPASPTQGQESTQNGRTFVWDGSAWNFKIGRSTHADATNWLSRVTTAGGTVSTPTLTAVSDFAYAIETAGIRSLLTRVNLFCGSSLTAALVPLYTSGTTGGSAVGNSTDTNVNFVSGDYSESGGLVGNGTNKYLRTGVTPALIAPTSSIHLSYAAKNVPSGSGLPTVLGQGDTSEFSIRGSSTARECQLAGVFQNGFLSAAESHQVVSRTASNAMAMYVGGARVGSNTTASSANTSTREFAVFALNSSGTFTRFNSATLWMYSIGGGLTAEQVRQFSIAVQNFNFALGRL